MEQERVSVLSALQINRKIERIAHQIIEHNYREDTVVLIGVSSQGFSLAKRIEDKIRENSSIKTELLQLKMDKKDPISGAYSFSGPADAVINRSVFLVDDVLNSGRTLIYAAREVLKHPVKKLTTVILIDRRHRKFPVKADFVGLTLSTTMQEHITVELEPGKELAYLE